ncbi:MAG: GxxExxY protein [Spirochaetales bacterium]|nr:GxxExxY protein [Spirochaetales bacterium]
MTQSAEELNILTEIIIGRSMDLHRILGPGLLESAYEECLAHELRLVSIPFERQKLLPLEYKGIQLDCAYRLDLVVAGSIVVEIKAVDHLLPVHTAQLLTYLKLGGWSLGLLLNFNVPILKAGIKRVVHRFPDTGPLSAPLR